MDATARGAIMFDQLTGNTASLGAQTAQRQIWSINNNVAILPALPSHASAKGQPCDAVHGHFRRMTDLAEDLALGHTADASKRAKLEDLVACKGGFAKKTISAERIAEVNLLCWERMPRPMMRWAWTSRGYITKERMAELSAMRLEQLEEEYSTLDDLHKIFNELQELPKPLESSIHIHAML